MRERLTSSTGISSLGRAPLRARATGWLWATALRTLRATWRLRVEGLATFDATLAAGRPLLAAFWHEAYVPLLVLFEQRSIVVFTSHSRRGAVIAEICRRFAYSPVLIRDRGGAHSLEAMRAALRARPAGGLAVDGPLGPYHRVKPGVVTLASKLDMLVFPIAIAARPQRRSAGRWDRMLFPLPFARVALVVGEALAVPPDLTTTEAAAWRQQVHDALEDAGRRARTLIGDAESGNAVADGRVPGILPPG